MALPFSLRDLALFDSSEMIQHGEAGRKRRTLAELGGLAAQGDYRGAQAAAFAGGETELGMRLKEMNDQDKERLMERAGRFALATNSEAEWEAARPQWAAEGYDLPPFAARDTMIKMTMPVLQQIQMQREDARHRESMDLQRQKLAQAASAGGGGVFGTPIFGEGPNGETAIMALTKDGRLQPAPAPEGFTALSPYGRSFQTAQGKVEGEALGEGRTELAGSLMKAQQSVDLIDQMLQHPGRATATGLSGTLDPRNYIAGTDATDFNVMRRQLEGKAFLEAFESLKGGGQITEIEGQKATEAIARLNTAQSDEAYVRALMELRSILMQGMRRSEQRAGAPAPRGNGAQPGDDIDALINQYAPGP